MNRKHGNPAEAVFFGQLISMEGPGMVNEAIRFAMEAHEGQKRKGTTRPYITHPLEVATIVSYIRPDETLLAAALLHDTMEDCGVTGEMIRERFGLKVATLVAAETDDKSKPWPERKEIKLRELSRASEEVQIIALSDKLANIREIWNDYYEIGDRLWSRFSAGNKDSIGWYYRGLREALSNLSYLPQYQEFSILVSRLFDSRTAYASVSAES